MRIDIPNNKRHFVVAEELRDRCVVTSAAPATWRNVNVVDAQLMAIGIVIQILCCFRCGSEDRGRPGVLSTKGIVSLNSISRLPPLFLWRSSRTASRHGFFLGLVLLVSVISWIVAMLTLLLRMNVSSSVILPLISITIH